AVGDRFQAGRLLLADQRDDLAVFDDLECRGVDLAALAFLASIVQRRRAQQAADMVGAERGCGALHGSTRRHCERSEGISPSLAHAFADGDCFGALRAPRNDIYPHTSFERSTIIFSFAHCSSSASTLPSSVEAKPHCGESASWSSATDFVASSRRRLMSS